MAMSEQRRAQVIAWERWRLRHELENVARAQSVGSMNSNQANADNALRRLVELGCDEAEELRRAQELLR